MGQSNTLFQNGRLCLTCMEPGLLVPFKKKPGESLPAFNSRRATSDASVVAFLFSESTLALKEEEGKLEDLGFLWMNLPIN